MKRVFGMITLAALLAVGSASCKKTETNASFTFALPAVEGFSADEGRAYIDVADGSKMKWYDGDQMMIYSIDATHPTPDYGVFTVDPGSTGLTRAHFNGPSMRVGTYFAFYPASKAVSVASDNYATFEVGNTQTYNHELNIMSGRAIMDPRGVVAASSCSILNGEVAVSLQHIFGFANVKVKGAKKNVTSVSIRDNVLNLTGTMTIQIPAITDARLAALQALTPTDAAYMESLTGILHEMGYSSVPNGNIVTLNCEGAAVPIEVTSNKYFIIPLRPGALFGDFDIIITYDSGDPDVIHFPNSSKEYFIRPGWFSNIQVTI